MSASCCSPVAPAANDHRYRRILWVALVVNLTMFAIEAITSARSDSVSLLADAIDFLGDAANYAISLLALGWSIHGRARASLVKAVCMAMFGVLVLGRAGWSVMHGSAPEPATMGLVAALALAANAGVAALLFSQRNGDSNRRSVWICSRNDAIGNLAVGLAALGVFGTGDAWPDLAVAALMAGLALMGAVSVARLARTELATPAAVEVAPACCAIPEPVRISAVIPRVRRRPTS
ncbi:cation diffusion facilitator family transporter [soil metagenome]